MDNGVRRIEFHYRGSDVPLVVDVTADEARAVLDHIRQKTARFYVRDVEGRARPIVAGAVWKVVC